MGGMPQELVFDQDGIVCVSEKTAAILSTPTNLKNCVRNANLASICVGQRIRKVRVKWKMPSKYVKYNFLENRIYLDDETLNYCCLQWLERTANAKVHGTTKRIPAEVFTEEREHLRPLCPSPGKQ